MNIVVEFILVNDEKVCFYTPLRFVPLLVHAGACIPSSSLQWWQQPVDEVRVAHHHGHRCNLLRR